MELRNANRDANIAKRTAMWDRLFKDPKLTQKMHSKTPKLNAYSWPSDTIRTTTL